MNRKLSILGVAFSALLLLGPLGLSASVRGGSSEVYEGASLVVKNIYKENCIQVVYSHSLSGTDLIYLYDPKGNLAVTYTCVRTGTKPPAPLTATFTYNFQSYRGTDLIKSVTGVWKMWFDAAGSQYDCVDYANVGFLVLDLSAKRGQYIEFQNSAMWGKQNNITMTNRLPTYGTDTVGVGQGLALQATKVAYFNAGNALGVLELRVASVHQDLSHNQWNEMRYPRYNIQKITSWDPNPFSSTNKIYGTTADKSSIKIPYQEAGCVNWVNMTYPSTLSVGAEMALPARGLIGFVITAGIMGVGGPFTWVSALWALTQFGYWSAVAPSYYPYHPDDSGYGVSAPAGWRLDTVSKPFITYDWEQSQYLRIEFKNDVPAGTTYCFVLTGDNQYTSFAPGSPTSTGYMERIYLVLQL